MSASSSLAIIGLTTTVCSVVDLLIAGEFERLEAMTNGRALAAEDIRGEVASYGRTLCSIPVEEWTTSLDIIQVSGTIDETYSVVVSLWTTEEGRSDLSLEMDLSKTDTGFNVEILNLHVL